MELEQQVIDEIVRRLTAVAPIERIILFGSAAQGTMTADSDIDLLVLKRQVGDYWTEWLMADDALRGLGYPVDVVLMPTLRFDETAQLVGGVAYPARLEGRVIYEAA